MTPIHQSSSLIRRRRIRLLFSPALAGLNTAWQMVFDLCYESSSFLAANGFSYSIEALIFLVFALFAVKPLLNRFFLLFFLLFYHLGISCFIGFILSNHIITGFPDGFSTFLLKIPCNKLHGISDCKEFCQFFDLFAFPAASCGECARCCSSITCKIQVIIQGFKGLKG